MAVASPRARATDGASRARATGGTSHARAAEGTARTDRRRRRSRAALIRAAQELLAGDGRRDVSIQEITDRADVGFGTFYGHFQTKDELFDAAVHEILERHGQLLDELTAGIADPAEVYIASVRLTGRLADTYPQMARVLCNTGLSYVVSDEGLAPRALRDLRAAIDAGRFDVDHPEIVQAAVGASLLGLLQYLVAHPGVDAAEATDELATALLRMLGMTRRQATSLMARPLPEPAPSH